MPATVTKAYLKQLEEEKKKNEQRQLRANGGYLSPYKENGELRENGRAAMVAAYGLAGL